MTNARCATPLRFTAAALAIGLLVTASCGGGGNPDLSPIDLLPPKLDGIWTTDCIGGHYGQDFGAIVSRSFTEPGFTAHTQIFGSRWCNAGSELSTATLTGTYVTGEQVMGNLQDAIEIDLTVANLTLTLHNETDVSATNRSTATSDWAKDVPVAMLSTLGDSCTDDSGCRHAVCDGSFCVADTTTNLTSGWRAVLSAYVLPEITAGTIAYDIVKITTATLQVGELEVGFVIQPVARPIGLADPVLFPQE